MQRSIGTLLGRIGAAALRGKPQAQHRAMAAAPMFDAEDWPVVYSPRKPPLPDRAKAVKR